MLPMMMESFQVQDDTMVASVSSDEENEGNDTETQKFQIENWGIVFETTTQTLIVIPKWGTRTMVHPTLSHCSG